MAKKEHLEEAMEGRKGKKLYLERQIKDLDEQKEKFMVELENLDLEISVLEHRLKKLEV